MRNSARRVLAASLAGTTIEFFDFYIYGTATVLVFPTLFFPRSSPTAAAINSLATFALAFLARPLGSLVFGHFGDRLGRKATLVAALLTMGLSTFAIGLVPGYARIGLAAPVVLALCRVGQGIGLGGEWGGAVLLATENAPPGRAAWYGMFPQLGAPLGYLLAGGSFILLSLGLTNNQFMAFGWRLPFLVSSVLVWMGLYVRLKLTETPAFTQAMSLQERQRVPILTVLGRHVRPLALGILAAFSVFVVFYLLTLFCLNWGTQSLGYPRERFLEMQLVGMLFLAAAIPLSAWWAERAGRRVVLIAANVGSIVFGFAFSPLFHSGSRGALAMLCIGFALMGLNYGPLGTYLAEIFPTAVRYTGSSMAFNLAGILGASPTAILAIKLAQAHGLPSVGYFLSASAAVSLLALLASRSGGDAAST